MTDPSSTASPDSSLQLEQDDLVIYEVDEHGVQHYYHVPAGEYRKTALSDDLKSAPEFLVALGVVAADIPRVSMAGSTCILLNLASIRMQSPKLQRSVEQPPASSH